MSILKELNTLISSLSIPVETGLFSDTAPDEYVVIIPMSDEFEGFYDNTPHFETQEARMSLFSKSNYLNLKQEMTKALLDAGFEITDRRYIGYEDGSSYHHYSIDVLKLYKLED